jgi:acyl-[acyl carrier protein]--UDP-N-acetylglucosamine O-acyltransferase
MTCDMGHTCTVKIYVHVVHTCTIQDGTVHAHVDYTLPVHKRLPGILH